MSGALKLAIDLAELELCKRAVEDGASLSVGFRECQGCTPLLYALHRSPLKQAQLDIVELLVVRGASIEGTACNLCKNKGFTVLHYAATFGYLQLLQMLLNKHPMAMIELRTAVHPIHLACFWGHLGCVELMVNHHQKHIGT